ncbi:MAG: hypothetical protein AAF441_09170 [Pseudomonadota bacterium]
MKRLLTLAAACLAAPVPVLAEEVNGPAKSDPLAPWDIYASSTTQVEYYDINGARAQSAFPFSGGHWFTELDVQARRQISPYESIKIDGAGVFNRSRYRLGAERGAVLERYSTTWEKGDAGIPFRATGGDFFADVSPRTISRSLRGAQIDLQPQINADGTSVSVLAFFGRPSGLYTDFLQNTDADLYAGASVLLANPDNSSALLSFVHNTRARAGATAAHEQNVLSVAGEKNLYGGGQYVTIEGEAAYFTGDHTGPGTLRRDRDALGIYASLTGYSQEMPLNYSFLYERYGRNFQPHGRVVSADRETLDARGGWRFDNGLYLALRAQRFRDRLESANTLTTYTAGATLTGPLFASLISGASGSWDSFYSRARNQTRATNTETWSSRLNVQAPLNERTSIRAGVNAQVFTNFAGRDSTSAGFTLGADSQIELAGWTGTLSPEVYFRDRSGLSALSETGAGIGFNLYKDNHSVDLNMSTGYQNARTNGGTDNVVHDVIGRYRYRHDIHTFGLEGEVHTRAPQPGANGQAYRIAAFYTVELHKPARRESTGRFLYDEPGLETGNVLLTGPDGINLAALRPGLPFGSVQQSVAASGVTDPTRIGALRVYELAAFPRLSQRQRLAVEERGGRVVRAVIAIDLALTGNRDSIERTLARVRESLSRRLGPPGRSFEEGAFTATPADDINSGRVVRIYEWRTPGGIIRLGLPRRTDRAIRIEVHYAKSMTPPANPFWSLNDLR